MFAGCGQSRFAAAAVASSPAGADANARDEPTSGRGSERGSTAQERTVEQGGKRSAGVISTDALGNQAPCGSARVARRVDSSYRGINGCNREAGRTASGGATTYDASRCWST